MDVEDIGTGVKTSVKSMTGVYFVLAPSPEGIQLDEIPLVATGDAASTSSDHNNNDDTQSQVASQEPFINTPLQLGQTLVIYHPHSHQPPEIIKTAELTLPREPQHSLLPAKPWAPFTSCDDFEQAELFIKHNCTN